MPEQKVEKQVTVRSYLDKRRDPPEYIDEELPTTTILLKGPAGRVTTRTPRGTNAEGSYRITGSHYDTGKGTYSLRITRVNVSAVGTTNFQGTVHQWHIRHSRRGTIDVLTFGEQGRVILTGGPRSPVYAVGPGTLFWGWDTFKGEMGTQVALTQVMEAIPG